jgi:hypothetical protein
MDKLKLVPFQFVSPNWTLAERHGLGNSVCPGYRLKIVGTALVLLQMLQITIVFGADVL